MEYFLIISESYDPFYNLGLEEELLNNIDENHSIFFLWQNRKTVVIGKNQEALAECNYHTLTEEGGTLARRSSGGGAVYQDLGNLNYSFIMDNKIYDVNKQLTVIVESLKKLGLDPVISGRNDITINNSKFSGNAFLEKRTHSLHHGTILIDVNFQELNKYLLSNPYKVNKHKITSVVSRVINLKSLIEVDVDIIKDKLIESFNEIYNCQLKSYPTTELRLETYDLYASKRYRLGDVISYNYKAEGLFNSEYYKVLYQLNEGVITEVVIYSDTLDKDIVKKLTIALKDSPLDKAELTKRLQGIIESRFIEEILKGEKYEI